MINVYTGFVKICIIQNKMKERLLRKGFHTVIDLRIPADFTECFREEMVGGIPIVYANHQSHADGIALAVISNYLRGLSTLKGLSVPIAASMESGDQSLELKQSFDLLKPAVESMGLVSVPVTRMKDVEQYGMSRGRIRAELSQFTMKIKEGYGIALLPEGSVQGGRHPIGSGIDEIYGMRRAEEGALLGFRDLVARVGKSKKKSPFFIPVGLHGGYRFVQSPEGGKPKPTRKGWMALGLGMLGIPTMQIRVNLGMPISAEQSNLYPSSEEEYLMRQVAQLVPPIARGVYSY